MNSKRDFFGGGGDLQSFVSFMDKMQDEITVFSWVISIFNKKNTFLISHKTVEYSLILNFIVD